MEKINETRNHFVDKKKKKKRIDEEEAQKRFYVSK